MVRAVEDITTLAGRSGEALDAIVDMVAQTSDQVRAIAQCSQRQSSASDDINRNIEEVGRISSETSEAMRQSARAVNDLAQQARVLRSLIEDMGDNDAGLPPGKQG